MTAITIHPTNVRNDGLGADGTIVGSPDSVWGDGLDSTYAESSLIIPDSPSTSWNMIGDVQYDVPAGVGVAVSDVTIRVQRINSGGAVDNAVRAGIVLPGDSGPEANSSALGEGDPSASPYFGNVHTDSLDTIETVSGLYLIDPDTGAAWTDPTALANLFRTGFTIALRGAPLTFPYAEGTYTLRVYEVTFTLEVLSPCYQELGATFDSAYDPDTTSNAPDATVLRDGNPATYVTTSASGSDSPVEAYLDLYTHGRTATDLTVTIVAAGGDASAQFNTQIISGRGSVPHILISTPLFTVPAGSGQTTYTYTFTEADYADFGYTLADITARLAGSDPDTALDIQVAGHGLMVSEVSLRVGHKCVVNIPQLRKYPNPNIGPTRQWPRPRRGITGIR